MQLSVRVVARGGRPLIDQRTSIELDRESLTQTIVAEALIEFAERATADSTNKD
jgi:hypothetical protein